MSSPTDNKQFITDYLNALSGLPRTAETVVPFVADQKLLDHIFAVESAFPAYQLIPAEIVAEDDLVVVRGMFRGTHTATFAGIEATGKTVSASLMVMYRIEGDRIVDHWLQFDFPALVAQLQEPVAALNGPRERMIAI